MKLIDADKLKQHVLENWEMERKAGSIASEYRAAIWHEIYESLQSDMFDPTPPLQTDTPDIKIGDKVYHAKFRSYGIVGRISASGKRAYMNWNEGSYSSYVDLKSLEVINE
jgi:hypothetical protein